MELSERQLEIIETASRRIDEHGIQSLTIKNLATDIGLSEPALYRHFKSKDDILTHLLDYFKNEMKTRIEEAISGDEKGSDELRAIFSSQLKALAEKPAIVSVIFSEGVFHYDKNLSSKVKQVMKMMQDFVSTNIETGQNAGLYKSMLPVAILTTVVTGSMRMAVLKWKLSGIKTDLVKDGMTVLNGVLKMIEK